MSEQDTKEAAVVAVGNTLYFFNCNGMTVSKGKPVGRKSGGDFVWVALPGNIELAQKVAALFSEYKRETKPTP